MEKILEKIIPLAIVGGAVFLLLGSFKQPTLISLKKIEVA